MTLDEIIGYAWFSEKQSRLIGTVEYRRHDGTTIVCSSVSQSMDGAPNFDDTKFVGEVVYSGYVRRVTLG